MRCLLLLLLLPLLYLGLVTDGATGTNVIWPPKPQRRCSKGWPFCPYPEELCRNGGWWCPGGYTCSRCDYPDPGRCCYHHCKSFSSYIGQPCRRKHSCFPCGSSTSPLCCRARPTSLSECKATCHGPYVECYLHGCPMGHRGWCCRWKLCWGPWCAESCARGYCPRIRPSLSAAAKKLMKKG